MYTVPSLSLRYSPTSSEMLQTLETIDTKKHHELNNAICNQSTSTSSSFKLISALRGEQEKSGLGAKPKLSVTWALDVQEPRPSLHYHFVRGQRSQNSRKKDHKQRSKGKIRYKSGSPRNEKKHKSKRSHSFDSAASRLPKALHVIERANIHLMDRVVIQGSRPVGLLSTVLAQESGALQALGDVVLNHRCAHKQMDPFERNRKEKRAAINASSIFSSSSNSTENKPDLLAERRRIDAAAVNNSLVGKFKSSSTPAKASVSGARTVVKRR